MVPRTQSSRQTTSSKLAISCALTQMILDRTPLRRGLRLAVGVLVALLPSQQAHAVEPSGAGQSSGLPVPRFVSLKSDKVNVRGGPTKDHEVAWMFTRSGLPVEVTAEF